jgi:hypothetical protein
MRRNPAFYDWNHAFQAPFSISRASSEDFVTFHTFFIRKVKNSISVFVCNRAESFYVSLIISLEFTTEITLYLFLVNSLFNSFFDQNSAKNYFIGHLRTKPCVEPIKCCKFRKGGGLFGSNDWPPISDVFLPKNLDEIFYFFSFFSFFLDSLFIFFH